MCAAVKTFSIGKFDLNPRGNLWAKDESGLGRRLLRRMGWREGRGLGSREDGSTQGIRLLTTKGNAGIGFTEKLPFIKESLEYDSVLENLNKKFRTDNESTKAEEKGLEQRSQQFKKRLHYQKFVRGKDVGRYSQKDMDAIFGSKSSNSVAESPPLCSAPPTFQSSLSMKEYFAMKLEKKTTCVEGRLSSPTKKRSLKDEEEACVDGRLSSPTKKRSREDEEGPSCLELPARSRYDAWLESQRTATRMKLYRGLVRRMRTHPVLKTANLLHIKGYGNWGME